MLLISQRRQWETEEITDYIKDYYFIDRLYDATVMCSRWCWLREHERRCVLEQLAFNELRGGGLEVLLGAELALDIAIQIGAGQRQRYQN